MLDFQGSGLSSWDYGSLKAHQIAAVSPMRILQGHLQRARRDRGRLLARLLPRRRKYLDGLIAGLEKSLERRLRETPQTG